MQSRSARIRALWLLLAAAFLAPGLQAQDTGQISGRITDANTAAPLGSVQITVGATGVGGLSSQNGRYLLNNVPAGTHELTLQRIGYRAATQSVEVTAGEVVEANVRMSEEALQLDAVIVTGTAGGTRQRAIGNVVSRVAASEIADVAPINTVQDLLGGREAGVDFLRSSGNVGTGSSIRIRGYTSLNVGNQPLIYVDGIRIDNAADAGPNLRDGSQVSKLDDINPQDIESIEIIKGPAAATLYGTEASNGVIQIITKRGSEGTPQFDFTVRQGANWLRPSPGSIGR